ncbi:unnamed protein product [Schistosoma guineensis]|nr:unnamed protein product [Schistosoma guineensis]
MCLPPNVTLSQHTHHLHHTVTSTPTHPHTKINTLSNLIDRTEHFTHVSLTFITPTTISVIPNNNTETNILTTPTSTNHESQHIQQTLQQQQQQQQQQLQQQPTYTPTQSTSTSTTATLTLTCGGASRQTNLPPTVSFVVLIVFCLY